MGNRTRWWISVLLCFANVAFLAPPFYFGEHYWTLPINTLAATLLACQLANWRG